MLRILLIKPDYWKQYFMLLSFVNIVINNICIYIITISLVALREIKISCFYFMDWTFPS